MGALPGRLLLGASPLIRLKGAKVTAPDDDAEAAYLDQLKELRRLGYIDADPEVVLEHQRHPRGQRLLPQMKQ